MSTLLRDLALLPLLVLVGSASARAATLPFQGRVDAVFGGFPFVVSVEGSGVATVNGDGTGGALTALALPAGVFHATGLNFPGTTALGVIEQIRVTAANGIGNFANLTVQGGGRVMALPGVVRFCLLATCDTASVQLQLPLDPIGAGGTAKVTGAVSITVEGMPWTKGLVTISTPGAVTILEGFAHGPLSNTTSTAQPGGVLELVTPAAVRTNIQGLENLSGYAILRVEFVPEPASGALVAMGLALLVAGRRAQQRRAS